MKQFVTVVITLFLFIYTSAQYKVPPEVAQKLQNDQSFTGYAKENMQYVRRQQQLAAPGSRERTFFEKQEKHLARQLWWLEGRQSADGKIINSTRSTVQELDRYMADQGPVSEATANGSWSIVGPINSALSTTSYSTGIGRVDRIAFHPTNANIIYAGTPAGGIFRSSNAGASWSNLNSFMPSLGVSGLVVSWSDPSVIYALTGDGDSNIGDGGFVQGFDYIRPSTGVLKSTNGGVSWQHTADFGITEEFYVGYKLVQSPTDPEVLMAATSHGLYRTANGGQTWTRISAEESRYYDVEWKPGSSTRVYACTANTFFLSTNGGESFAGSNDHFDVAIGTCSRIAIAVTPANANYVYVYAAENEGNGVYDNKGVYRSTNSGDSFIQRTTSNTISNGLPEYMHNIAVASDDVNVVLTGTLDIFRSTSGGTSFVVANSRGDANQPNYCHADIHELAYNPLDHSLYVGCDGGVYRSTDDGVSFTALYNGMNATQFYHFDVSDTDDNYIYGGAQDNGGIFKNGITSTWLSTVSGDGYDVRFYNGATSRVWVSVNQSILRSNADMTEFTQIPGLTSGWYKTIAMSYFNTTDVFTSSDPVYRSTNSGTTWTIENEANGRWAMITCPSNVNRVYAAGGSNWNDGGDQVDKKLFLSDDKGLTWSELQENTGFPEEITKITSIAVDPANSSRVCVTMGGFTDGQKVYFSTNAGNSWTNLSGSLPNLPVNCVAIDANYDIYIGTDVGVFYRGPFMNDWQPFFNNLPRVPVTEMHIRGSVIYASTFGRGIWKSDTHGACPALIDGFIGSFQGVKFYEAGTINTDNTLIGGDGTQISLRAVSQVNLQVGFRANAATGEKFRAWIGNCESGGIPAFRKSDIADAAARQVQPAMSVEDTEEESIVRFQMPFAAGASVIILDEEAVLKEVLIQNKRLQEGPSVIRVPRLARQGRKIVWVVDGEIKGVL